VVQGKSSCLYKGVTAGLKPSLCHSVEEENDDDDDDEHCNMMGCGTSKTTVRAQGIHINGQFSLETVKTVNQQLSVYLPILHKTSQLSIVVHSS